MSDSVVITAIDIGTSKIRVLLGETPLNKDGINIIGYSEKSSDNGVIKGEILDINKISRILKSAMLEAEERSGTYIFSDTLYVAVTGNHVSCKDSSGTVIINSTDKKIRQEHINEALRNAKSIPLPTDSFEINNIDGYFVIDGSYKVAEPLHHTATRLEAHSHIVYGNKNRIGSFESIVREQGFDSCIPVFSGLASALSVMTEDDFLHGTLAINIGAGTSEYTIFNDYNLKDLGVFTVGCDHIANDLFLGIDVPMAKARDILNSNMYLEKRNNGEDFLDLQTHTSSRRIPIASIEKIIDLRVKEMFDIINNRIISKKLQKLIRNGIVLCGGITKVPNALELAKATFEMPVRLGIPMDMSGPDTILKDPGNITALGLLRYAKKDIQNRIESGEGSIATKIDKKVSSVLKKIIGKMKQ